VQGSEKLLFSADFNEFIKLSVEESTATANLAGLHNTAIGYVTCDVNFSIT
jgi:hypothetical protein